MKTSIKIIKTWSHLLLLIIYSIPLLSQTVDYKVTDLKTNSWTLQGMTDKSYSEKYEDNKIVGTLKVGDNKFIIYQENYFSDSIESIFDSNKVGKAIKGRYIVERPLKYIKKNPNQPQPIVVFEILELNSTKLLLREVGVQNILEYKANY